MLQIRDIQFSYSTPVLKGASFDVESGQLLAVLGPNGSGKSTLIKIIVGILTAERGAALLDGRNLRSMSRRESAQLIGYVAQESAIRFPLTVMEFVLQGRFAQGRLIGFESERDVREAERAMELTETMELASRPVTQLSGGERQRVMLARALAVRPRVLVLDEPVANLDISHQVKMLELVKNLTLVEGAIGIVVTHELNLAAEFATHVLLLKSGDMIACGEPREVMTETLLRSVFDTELMVDVNPASAAPRVTLIAPHASRITRSV
ncbi:MAG TPA: ABC transporter ATP-binding protein [Blastocatellia bacterium]|nr:ABC transporter ATP-binding protein [Blastocatellia bacterium]